MAYVKKAPFDISPERSRNIFSSRPNPSGCPNSDVLFP